MSALLIALALLAAQAPAEASPAAQPAAAEAPYPVGAPRDDYQFVSWCYGALRGYLDLHDQVMPEVTRIETTWRRPGSNLSEDLKVYSDMQREGQRNLKVFGRAMTAAEKASLRPINAVGAGAVRKGRAIWTISPGVSKARVAQEWMSWALPARCTPTAVELEKRALLAGSALQVNAEPEEAAAPPPEPAALAEPAPAAAPEAPPAGPQSVDEALDAAQGRGGPAPDVAAVPAHEATARP